MSFLPKSLYVCESVGLSDETVAVLTPQRLTLGSTVYNDGEIRGQIEFAEAPRVPASVNPTSACTKISAAAKIDALYNQPNVWTGQNVFETANKKLSIEENDEYIILDNTGSAIDGQYNPKLLTPIDLDYTIWIRGQCRGVFLPVIPKLNQKITVRNDKDDFLMVAIDTLYEEYDGYNYHDARLYQLAVSNEVPLHDTNIFPHASIHLTCVSVNPPQWLQL